MFSALLSLLHFFLREGAKQEIPVGSNCGNSQFKLSPTANRNPHQNQAAFWYCRSCKVPNLKKAWDLNWGFAKTNFKAQKADNAFHYLF
jgi:hypothetical protein